jgi:DNA-binding XRE family transcriptional regulator
MPKRPAPASYAALRALLIAERERAGLSQADVAKRVQARHLAMIWISEKEELNVVLEAVERHEHQR